MQGEEADRCISYHDFYERFQKQLEESQNWPGLYMFKFIVKSNSLQIDKLKDLFK